ncbi:tagaturonate reductase [Alkaliphilus transvaalensis]|uniref:tagaturonate reductase n=1 Tax=Alkaliphilus transvaalensis TaxID=114628 RepID=UPI00047D3CCE|nr:tagaturonate reductase [Alkaliphilus transvaalensis]
MKLNQSVYKEFKKYPERILQFGEGNFLRGFADWMVDKLNKEAGFDSGVLVIQPRNGSSAERLNGQDGLYTLYMNGIKDGKVLSEVSVNNAITRGINTFSNYDLYLAAAENPELKLVFSNTTEAGIEFNENDKLEDRPQQSFPGKLTAFLYHRYRTFNGDPSKGMVFIPCELIDKNGEKLKDIILKLAKLWNLEEGFISWINEANTFCNSLVDRIVPGKPKERMEEITKELGYVDDFVVEAEQFHLWVIEGPQWIKDIFPAHKIGLNVLVVDDMTPYRTRKVRILNGAHTTMVPVAYLYGCETVKESVEDEVIGKYIKEAIFQEIIPTLDLSKEELDVFANDVLDRFRNPFIKHYLMSIALNSMSKFETRVLPSILEYKKRKNALPQKLVFSLASLISFYKGERDGVPIALSDDQDILEMFATLWNNNDGSEEALYNLTKEVLGAERIWKMDLNEVEGLTDAIASQLVKIEKSGLKIALQEMM